MSTILAKPDSLKNVILIRVLPLLFWFLGVTVFAWAVLDTRFRSAEGVLTGRICLPLSMGIALFIAGYTVAGKLRAFGFWLALALLGQAVALQLIQAGPYMRYQHYLPLSQIHPLLLSFLVVQAGLVVRGLVERWSSIGPWLRKTFKLWQLIGLGLIFFLTSATVSPRPSVYAVELIFAAAVQAINLGGIILAVWALPVNALASAKMCFERLFGPATVPDETTAPGRLDRFALLLAVWVFILAAALNYYAYQQHPHIPDEVAYLYQARFLATGELTQPLPPVPAAFDFYLMHFREQFWYPSPPPGWPAMLAIGVWLGAGWLVNPVLTGLNILVGYLLLRELYSRRTARLSIFLLALSPWYVFMGMNFMTHQFTLTCALLAAVGVAWAGRTGRSVWAWAGGLGLGMLAIIRPLEAFVVAGLLGLWAIGLGGRRLKVASLAGLGLATILSGALVLPYNWVLTGSPTRFPIMAYTDEYFGPNSNALGFGPDRGMGWPIDPFPGHSLLDAAVNANLNTFSINIELFGWSTGSLLVIALLLFAGRLRRSDYLLLALVTAIFTAHIFYYFSGGPDFGARYWYLMIIPCVALTARGLQFLGQQLDARGSRSILGDARVMAAVLVLCLLALVNYFPWRAIDKYYHYLNMRPDIRYLAQEYNFGRSLVFIRGDEHPDYASAAVYNPVDVYVAGPLYVRNLSPEVTAQVAAAYPGWPVWLVDGPTITGAGYRVVAGPLAPQELQGR